MLEARTVPAGQKFNMLLGRQKSARQSVGEHVRPYLRAANIDIGVLALGDVQAMNFEPHEQEKYSLRNGDILLVEGGSLGQAARWNGEIDGFVGFDKHVIRLRQVDEVSTSEFALQWCHWAREVGAFEAQATGITIKALGFGRASAMPVPDLSIEEQKHFTAPLAAVEAARERVADELADLRRFRLVLLAALLCQEIAIPESYDDLLEEVS
jgi:type I restriction enzyme S subunit